MTGAGIFVPHLESSLLHKLPPETTVFSAEAWALLQAVFLAVDHG